MDSWSTKCFDDEVQAIQPGYELVTDHYDTKPRTLISQVLGSDSDNDSDDDEEGKRFHAYSSFNCNENINSEKEIIETMRSLGIGPSVDGILSSKKTLPTAQKIPEIIYQDDFPILMHSKYFKLKAKYSDEDSDFDSGTSISTQNSTLDSMTSHMNGYFSSDLETSTSGSNFIDEVLKITKTSASTKKKFSEFPECPSLNFNLRKKESNIFFD